MKIAWFSPRVPEHSEIAKNTERLEADLQRRFQTRFFSEQPGGFHDAAADRLYAAPFGQVPPELLTALNEVDVPIYNLGNHPAFFARTWFLNQLKPGIVILHDLKLHHFFEGIFRARLHDEGQYLGFLDEYYGAPGVAAGKLYWRQRIFIDFMAENFPMTAWGVRNALAAVVHTQPTLDAVTRDAGLPVILNTLPYVASQQRPDTTERPWEPGTERPVRVAIFGYLNVNRRVVEFFDALAGMEERARFEVHLFGTLVPHYEEEVRRAVGALELRPQVTFHGYVDEEVLDASLAGCDLAVNLRYPSMGEASASQLRIWNHALPSLVTKVDGYAALPADTVSFVRPEHEREDIQTHLRDFLANPGRHRDMGRRGRAILLAQHRPATYVDRLAQLCTNLADFRSRNNRLRMADRAAEGISAWSSITRLSGVEAHYGQRIAETF